MKEKISTTINYISRILENYVERGTIRRKYASGLSELLSCLQVTAIQLLSPNGRREDREALIADMQRCNVEIEKKIGQARPYLTTIEVDTIKDFRSRTFYNYQVIESLRDGFRQLRKTSYYPDEDQVGGIAVQKYNEAQKYLSSNGLARIWLYMESWVMTLSKAIEK